MSLFHKQGIPPSPTSVLCLKVQSILGYYAVAFFSAMLLLEDEEEREQVFECMYEQSVSLSTYEYLGI